MNARFGIALALSVVSASACTRALPFSDESVDSGADFDLAGSVARGTVGCDETTCGSAELCQICFDHNLLVSSRSCVARPEHGSYLPCPNDLYAFNVFCDEHDDCPSGERCSLDRGDTFNAFVCRAAPDRTHRSWCAYLLCASDRECAECGLSCRPLEGLDPTESYRACQ